MGAAIGLLVEADDVDNADLLDGLGDERDLRTDEVLIHHRRIAWQKSDGDRMVAFDRLVHEHLDAFGKTLGQRVELEVHACRERLHVPAGDGNLPLVPDDTAENVHRGVGAHQLETTLPVDDPVHDITHVWDRTLQRVPGEITFFAHLRHVGGTQGSGVVGLAATRRIEVRRVECDSIVGNGDDGCIELAHERIAQVGEVGVHGNFRQRRSTSSSTGVSMPMQNGPNSAYSADAWSKRMVYTTSFKSSGFTAKRVTPHS